LVQRLKVVECEGEQDCGEDNIRANQLGSDSFVNWNISEAYSLKIMSYSSRGKNEYISLYGFNGFKLRDNRHSQNNNRNRSVNLTVAV